MLQLNNKKEKNEIEDQNNVTVPNVVGMTFKEAEEEFKKIGLEYVILPWKAPLNDDIVTAQDPKDGTLVSKGEQIKINLDSHLTLKSDISYSGANFNITYSELKKKFDASNTQNYEIEYNISTYNNNVTTNMWCFKGYRSATLNERKMGSSTKIPFDAYYLKITYENSTQKVIEIQLIGDMELDDDNTNQMYKNYSVLLGCIDSKIYDNVAKCLQNLQTLEYKDNVLYILTEDNENFGTRAIHITTTACTEEDYEYMKNNNFIWKKQTNY